MGLPIAFLVFFCDLLSFLSTAVLISIILVGGVPFPDYSERTKRLAIGAVLAKSLLVALLVLLYNWMSLFILAFLIFLLIIVTPTFNVAVIFYILGYMENVRVPVITNPMAGSSGRGAAWRLPDDE